MNRGGRPRNAWTPSRKRKLARLHTLTTLDMNEITEVLRAHEFNPSSSDVQKRLRELLPRDYAKDWKYFRPLKGHSMSSRLDRLRRKQHDQSSNAQSVSSNDQTKGNDFREFEGPALAFRNYLGPHEVARQHVESSERESQSQLVIPALVLLDGSSIMATIEEHPELSRPRQSSTPTSTSTSQISRASSVLNLERIEERLKRSSSFIKHVQAVLRLSSTNSWRSSLSWRSSAVSVQSLLRMQGIVNSILRSRPTSEASTNALDLTSPDNIEPLAEHQSPEPRLSTVLKIAPSSENDVGYPEQESHPATPRVTIPRGLFLSEKEERLWHELIGDTDLECPFSARPEFAGMSLHWRLCCRHWVRRSKPICQGCGMQTSHRLAKLNSGRHDITSNYAEKDYIVLESLGQQDYFGNTPLHFAAGSPNWEAGFFMNKIISAPIKAVNTSGATFLHVLFEYLGSFAMLRNAVPLLRQLANYDFPFSLRDCHGRTAIHMLFDNHSRLLEKLHSQTDQDTVLEILDITELKNKRLMDNLGRSTSDLIRLDVLGYPFPRPPSATGNTFIGAISELTFNTKKWLASTASTDKCSWVDSSGDTALIAIMKSWIMENDETELPGIIKTLVQSGSAVDMRDRAGNTALAIATKRGLRPAVTALLDLGANLHCTNYMGVSILRDARRQLRQARRDDDDKLYAMILSCVALMIDNGAVMQPTGYQEWALPCSPLALNPELHDEVVSLRTLHPSEDTNLDLWNAI
ncbi:hypothetical protein EG329_005769 [Mollisiaceae sp. DMI_Dod_QoI]|nr:hypothetical protein EG329_005769 [Helotiales sp. DMI_Dod_QoI]